MHRLAPTPGGWNPDEQGVVFLTQTPAPLVILTAADTDIQVLAAAIAKLPPDFPAWRVANLLQLQQQLSIDSYGDAVLRQAQVIVIRLLGGRAYWSYGLEVVREIAQQTNATLMVIPGDDRPDPDLMSHSTAALWKVNQLWRYFTEGGVDNMVNALKFLADVGLEKKFNPPLPLEVAKVGRYQFTQTGNQLDQAVAPSDQQKLRSQPERNSQKTKVGILFYRAHYLAGNTLPIDALCQALVQQNLQPVPVFVSSLRDREVQTTVLEYFQPQDAPGIALLLNTTSFSIAQLETGSSDIREEWPFLWQQLDVPVLQVILSSGTLEQWESGFQGLSPRDLAMNVALPEVDGRIITRVVSFKAVRSQHPQLETDVVGYEPLSDRIEFVAELAANWVKLRQTPIPEQRIALILANYPTRDGRLANGVGLDTPASCIEILKALKIAGYSVTNIPENSAALIEQLTAGFTNDLESQPWRTIYQQLSLADYQTYFASLPPAVQQGICDRWGIIDAQNVENKIENFPIAGLQFGNIFVGIQPSRGYDLDPSLNYHAPDLEPTHHYLAFYHWLRDRFGAQAIVHVGKHGNLEWLPGKSIALSSQCYPEVAMGALPHFYPFIVNDPGEGSQAKRRSQAVILDHLTPPMTRAELYGPLQQLESFIDEYYEAQSLDPTRVPLLRDRILKLIRQENLHQDLQLTSEDESLILPQLDGYLCELKEAQIRDGLHIFGSCPQGQQLRDLIIAIARHPGTHRLGLTRALAEDLGFDFDPLTSDPTQPLNSAELSSLQAFFPQPGRNVGDAIAQLESLAADLVDRLLDQDSSAFTKIGAASEKELHWISDRLLPALRETSQEITQLLRGLAGHYIPSGPSGAPTRGRPEVLPTGRNFYAVDIRAIPTETAWDVGRKAAEAFIERYTQDNGEYPKTLGLSVWGTSTMRTGGDDIAEALALLGVQPIWDGPSRRVVDFEIVPVSVLGRPRVDVTLRISGFFRDAFPNLIDLFDRAVTAVASLAETLAENPLAAQVQQETQFWQAAGLTAEQALMRSRYRIFGSKPGAYGAGLQGLIEAQNWRDDQDLATAYINWSSYAYTSQTTSINANGISAPEAFEQRLKEMQIVLHNQDNREHDLLDSDDYYQFQGGLTVAVRAIKGENPHTYFGDHSLPENPKVRQLRAEIARVWRSRVVNPKWIAGVMRHGYKGAFEMSATLDYLFAYDVTTRCVEDFMYEGLAKAYLFDPTVQAFVEKNNPWALRDMAERLLEAYQRGFWQSASPERVDQLRAIAHQAEAVIESKTSV